MKPRYAALFLSCSPVFSFAQSECGNGRYTYPALFDSVVVTEAVQFGSNSAVLGGGQQTLYMDIYEPYGDTLSERPVVLVAFGGSFIGGTRGDVAELCERFAKLGYVAVAPDYRVGFFFPTSNNTQLAVTRCMHDLRGCIRCLRKTAAVDANPWRIDPERIIVGGVSAGAIGAVQVGYLDESSEIPEVLYDDTATIGGIEGISGWAGYDSRPLAVWSMSGMVGDTNWIHPGDVPLISLHEEGDIVVPFGTQEVSVIGLPTGLIASGSRDIHARMDHIGVPNCLTVYPGDDHVGYLDYDTENAIGLVAAFLAEVVCEQPITCGNLAMGVQVAEQGTAWQLYPNPTDGPLAVRLDDVAWITLTDASGRTMLQQRVSAGTTTLDLAAYPAGVYVLRSVGTATNTTRVVKQ